MLTAEQHAVRETGVGSSDAPAICQVDPWRSPLDVWWQKPTASRPAVRPEEHHTEETEAGQEFEDAIARIYARRMGVKLRRSGTLRHPEHPWALATPDRMIQGQRKGVEVKLVGFNAQVYWDDGPPDHVRIQVAWQMFVTGYTEWDVVTMMGTRRKLYHLIRDPELESFAFDMCHAFWHDHVLADVAPPPRDEEDRATYLRRRYGIPSDVTLNWAPEIQAAAERYLAADADVKAAEATKRRAQNDLLELLGDYRGARGEWGSVSAPHIDGRVNWEAVALEMAPGGFVPEEIIEKHRGGGHRRVGVYKKGARSRKEAA